MKKTVIISFLILISFSGFSKDSIFVRFGNLELLEDRFFNIDVTCNINGVILSPDTLIHKIPINNNGFDKFQFFENGDPNDATPTLTKFRSEETYIIILNTCSPYQLIVYKGESKIGLFKLIIKNKTDSIKVNYNSSGAWAATDTTCFSSGFSAMCLFHRKSLLIGKSNYKQYSTENILTTLNFHFLHGEIFVAEYNANTKQIQLKIEGYLKENESWEDYEGKKW